MSRKKTTRKRAIIDKIVEECGDECPHYRENNCADEGTNHWCTSTNENLWSHFRASSGFLRGTTPDFPDSCPLEDEDTLTKETT